MKKVNPKIIAIIVILIIAIILVICLVIPKLFEKNYDNEMRNGLHLTENEEDKVTIEYLGVSDLDNITTPLGGAQFLKAFEAFLSEDLQYILDTDEKIEDHFVFEYDGGNSTRFGNNFLVSKESVNNLVESFKENNIQNIGASIKTCDFSYIDAEKCCNITLTLNNDKTISGKVEKGSTSLEIVF